MKPSLSGFRTAFEAFRCLAASSLVTMNGLAGCGNDINPNPVATGPSCLERAVFENPGDSLYVLPYPVGAAYEIIQSYCSQGSHQDRFAWDFLMLFGDEVVAARGGVVDTVVEHYADDDKGRYHNNHLFVRQEDGTRALYAHFQQDGIWVQVGDRVSQGQVIGAIGESGTPTPCPFRECGILHFSVFPRYGDEELPVSFRNAGGRFDSRGGLMTRATYEALPY